MRNLREGVDMGTVCDPRDKGDNEDDADDKSVIVHGHLYVSCRPCISHQIMADGCLEPSTIFAPHRKWSERAMEASLEHSHIEAVSHPYTSGFSSSRY